jgi:hypothetical protein
VLDTSATGSALSFSPMSVTGNSDLKMFFIATSTSSPGKLLCGTYQNDNTLAINPFGRTWPSSETQLHSYHCVLNNKAITPYVDGVAQTGATTAATWQSNLAYANVDLGTTVSGYSVYARFSAVQVYYEAKSAASVLALHQEFVAAGSYNPPPPCAP